MNTLSTWLRALRPRLASHPRLKGLLKQADRTASRWHHSLAAHLPRLIQPKPRQLTVAVTAACNLRCLGCRYGRDFMTGKQLSPKILHELLEDARDAGIASVRLYGGEPLLYKALPAAIRHGVELGLNTYVTTNGILLRERIDELFEAGLRWMTIGFYGTGQHYDDYTQRAGHYQRLERSLQYTRDRYHDALEIQLNLVLVRSTTTVEAVRRAWEFAERFRLFVHVDLFGYSMPFFTTGPEAELAYRPGDRAQVEAVAAELVKLKMAHPDRFPQSLPFMRSIPDWLLLGEDMRIPCDAYQLVWVGADGSVQLCDVTFPLGNLNERRLRDILFGEEHVKACRDGFRLACPNCTCKSDSRLLKHAPSLRRYSR